MKYMLISLLLHAAIICLAVVIGSSFASEPKPVVIDLTLVASRGSAPPGPEKKSEKPGLEAPKVKDREKADKKVPRTVHKNTPEMPKPVEVNRVPAKSAPEVSEIPHAVRPADKKENIFPSAISMQSANYGNETANGGSGSSRTLSGPGSGPGAGSGSGTGNGASGKGRAESAGQMKDKYLREHFEYIRTLIQKNLVYPEKARRMGWAGKVVVSFVIKENGYVTDARIIAGSGYYLLDENVMETIRKVEPFPKPPVRAELKIPITYRLDF